MPPHTCQNRNWSKLNLADTCSISMYLLQRSTFWRFLEWCHRIGLLWTAGLGPTKNHQVIISSNMSNQFPNSLYILESCWVNDRNHADWPLPPPLEPVGTSWRSTPHVSSLRSREQRDPSKSSRPVAVGCNGSGDGSVWGFLFLSCSIWFYHFRNWGKRFISGDQVACSFMKVVGSTFASCLPSPRAPREYCVNKILRFHMRWQSALQRDVAGSQALWAPVILKMWHNI